MAKYLRGYLIFCLIISLTFSTEIILDKIENIDKDIWILDNCNRLTDNITVDCPDANCTEDCLPRALPLPQNETKGFFTTCFIDPIPLICTITYKNPNVFIPKSVSITGITWGREAKITVSTRKSPNFFVINLIDDCENWGTFEKDIPEEDREPEMELIFRLEGMYWDYPFAIIDSIKVKDSVIPTTESTTEPIETTSETTETTTEPTETPPTEPTETQPTEPTETTTETSPTEPTETTTETQPTEPTETTTETYPTELTETTTETSPSEPTETPPTDRTTTENPPTEPTETTTETSPTELTETPPTELTETTTETFPTEPTETITETISSSERPIGSNCSKYDSFNRPWTEFRGKDAHKECTLNQIGTGSYWFCTNDGVFKTEQPRYDCAPHWIGNIEKDFNKAIDNSNDGLLPLANLTEFLDRIRVSLTSVLDDPRYENVDMYFGGQIEDILNLTNSISKSLNCTEEKQIDLEIFANKTLFVNSQVIDFEMPWYQLEKKDRSRQFTKAITNFETDLYRLLLRIGRFDLQENYRNKFQIDLSKDNIELFTGLQMDLNSTDILRFPENVDLESDSYIELPRNWENFYEHNPNQNESCSPIIIENPKFSGIKISSDIIKDKLENFKVINTTFRYLNGPMMVFSFLPLTFNTKFKEEGRVKIRFKHDLRATKNAYTRGTFTKKEVSCVYWDPNELTWSTSGCTLNVDESDGFYSTCECDHLTSFAILMGKHEDENVLVILTIVLCSISNIFLVVTAYILHTTNGMHNTQGDISKIICILLFLGNVFIILMNPAIYTESNGQFNLQWVCRTTGIATHFVFMTIWVWMGILGWHLYTIVNFPLSNAQKSRSRIRYQIFGFAVPAIWVGGVAGISNFKAYSDGNDDLCWLKGQYVWTFLGPMTLIILFNTIVLLTSYLKTRATKNNPLKVNDKSDQRQNILGWLYISISLGMTWLPGYFLLIDETITSAYIFTILNSSQGIIIFVFHYILKEKFKASLNKILKIQDPHNVNLESNIRPTPSGTWFSRQNLQFLSSSSGKTQDMSLDTTA